MVAHTLGAGFRGPKVGFGNVPGGGAGPGLPLLQFGRGARDRDRGLRGPGGFRFTLGDERPHILRTLWFLRCFPLHRRLRSRRLLLQSLGFLFLGRGFWPRGLAVGGGRSWRRGRWRGTRLRLPLGFRLGCPGGFANRIRLGLLLTSLRLFSQRLGGPFEALLFGLHPFLQTGGRFLAFRRHITGAVGRSRWQRRLALENDGSRHLRVAAGRHPPELLGTAG